MVNTQARIEIEIGSGIAWYTVDRKIDGFSTHIFYFNYGTSDINNICGNPLQLRGGRSGNYFHNFQTGRCDYFGNQSRSSYESF
jgi:hypothetical protein